MKKIIGYYKSWDAPSYPPSKIDVTVYNHINYAFLGVNENGSLRLDNDKSVLYELGKLKTRNTNLKLLFSVGGETEGVEKFSSIAGDKAKTETLGQSAVDFLKKYKFDGIDIDWEFPKESDKKNFVNLLKKLRKKLDSSGNYLLSVAVSPLTDDPNIAYSIPEISKIVDFINVMTYNFHMPFEGRTGQNSPLYASTADSPWQQEHCNCRVSINKWINAGASKEKLVLGLAFYGHVFNLKNRHEHDVGAPTTSTGGTMAYKDIVQLKDWSTIWDDQQQVPYKFSKTQWIGYDNPRSVAMKMAYVKDVDLGGVMVWAINDDDTKGELALTIKINKVI